VRETLRIGDLIDHMLVRLQEVLQHGEVTSGQEIRRLDDDVDALYNAVKLYLAQIPREAMAEADARRWAEIVELAVNLEHAGDTIEHMLGKLQHHKTARRHSFSEKGLEELSEMHEQLLANLRLGLSVFLSGDRQGARQLLREKRRFRVRERRLAHAHVERLSQQVVQSIETSSLHLELIADMKRLNSFFCSSAYAVLEDGETGALPSEAPAPPPAPQAAPEAAADAAIETSKAGGERG
jgi:phosphate:Na+ symporter